jgi:hypothetical protein
MKDQLNKVAARYLNTNTYECEVKLDTVMDEHCNIFQSLNSGYQLTNTKGSVMLLGTRTPKAKRFPKLLKKSCSLVRQSLPLPLQKYLPSHATSARNLDIEISIVLRRIMRKENQMIKFLLRLWSLNIGSSTKVPSHTFTNITFIAHSGATGHMRRSLEGMFNMKSFVTDIMVGKNLLQILYWEMFSPLMQFPKVYGHNKGEQVRCTWYFVEKILYQPKRTTS